jgi:hypothetical protein
MAAGVSEDEAKLDICRATADRKIGIRLTLVIEPDASMQWHRMVQKARGLSPAVWERLPDFVARFASLGIDEAQAKQNICRAIAARRVKIRFRVVDSLAREFVGTVRSGTEVEIPADLKPSDLNWDESHPLNPWRTARQGDNVMVYIESIEVLIEGSDQSTECFEGANVNVPTHLQPSDFDWENSRPRKPWPVKMRGARLGEWSPSSIAHRATRFRC